MPEGLTRTVIVEEHHEAFFVWHYARANKWIADEPLALLHVDEHADMSLPVLRRPLRELATLSEIAKFTYSNLSINNFICPAIYQGLFDCVYWLRIKHVSTAGGWRRLRIASPSTNELTFSKVTSTKLSAPSGNERYAEYAPITTADSLPCGMKCILDIDLDYFCWNDYPELPELSIEITEDTYHSLRSDRYHFLRLSQNGRISAIRREGRPLLSFADPQPPVPVVTPRESVLQRIEEFAAYLSRHDIDPQLIVICRSRHSGYVQSAHVAVVEETLVERLMELFNLETHSIDELLEGSFQAHEIYDQQRPMRQYEELQYVGRELHA